MRAAQRVERRAWSVTAKLHAATEQRPTSGIPGALAWHSHLHPPARRTRSIAMLATVDALLPLSLLQAVCNVDTPADGLEAEYVDELRNNRLALRARIHAQIRRYSDAVRR